MNETKPGVKTTEFWLTAVLALVGPLVTILVGSGVIEAGDAAQVTETVDGSARAIVEAVTVVITNVVSLASVRKYVQARTDVKNGASN